MFNCDEEKKDHYSFLHVERMKCRFKRRGKLVPPTSSHDMKRSSTLESFDTVVAFPFALKIIISGRCEKKKLIFYSWCKVANYFDNSATLSTKNTKNGRIGSCPESLEARL
jgi:hypothetical protein